MKYFVYNEDGFGWFVFLKENETPPENSISVVSDCEFIKPRYVDGLLVEGLTEQESNLIKEEKRLEIDKQQYEELLPTDWFYTRFIETGIAVPQFVIDERNEIREKYKQLKNNYERC